ncbi:MAG: SDR family NAD(P)-dependent oxidoreductase [Myxococcaceae bacterium]
MRNRTAVITGGTDGIGKATARKLAADGWDVVIVGRNAARCEATARELGSRVSAVVGDLGLMADVKRVASEVATKTQKLDLLILNANSITQTFKATVEGFESNFAVGFLGRALLALELEPVLARAERSSVLSVVGLNLDRVDFADPSPAHGFSSMKVLGRWQWAVQVFGREWNRRSKVPMNTYMPGLVKTKILADEPQPMRLVVKVANLLMGVPVERGGEECAWAAVDALEQQRRDGYYARKRFKGVRDLKEQPGDAAAAWAMAERLLAPWRAR